MRPLTIVILLISLWPAFASAQTESTDEAFLESVAQCLRPQELDRYRLLRRLSLDLRQQLPSYEEYLALDDQAEVPEATVDEMIASDAFRVAARRFHEDLLWPNISNVAIADASIVLSFPRQGPMKDVLDFVSGNRRRIIRGGSGNERCGDWEQTEWLPNGSPVTQKAESSNGQTFDQDGWVVLEPYWLRGTGQTIKVCAFAAVERAEGKLGFCNATTASRDPLCGCGPRLQHCVAAEGAVHDLADHSREQLLMLVDDSTVGGRPYSEILTTQRIYTNGPLRHWKKHLAALVNPNKTVNYQSPGDADLLVDPSWTDTDWVEEMRSGGHSGILTLAAYTLRFQTNRGRANRMRVAFTGQYFVPPSGDDTDCDPNSEDLTERCTCRHCHQVLEPLAAHFGDVLESGSAMRDDGLLPEYLEKCDPTKNADVPLPCGRFYAVETTALRPGALLSHQYADGTSAVHDQVRANLSSGPAGWGTSIIDSGLFQATTVRHTFRWLMGRDMIVDPTAADNEVELLTTLTEELRAHDDFRTLIRRLVMLSQYRRVR